MFTRFTSLLVLVAPLVSALTLNTPTDVTSGGPFNLSWVTAPGDPISCTLEFDDYLSVTIIAQNVSLSLGFIILQCPIVPSSRAIIEAVNNGDDLQVFAETSQFLIANISSSGSASTTVSAAGTNTNTLTSTANSSSLPVTSSTSFSGGSSSSTGTGTAAASTTPSSNSSITIDRNPSATIIGSIIGGLVFISLLLALFFFNHRRHNRRSQALSDTGPSPDVVNPFTLPPSNPTSTFLPQDSASNGQFLLSQPISSKFTHQRGQLSDPASMSSSGGFPPLTPLRPQFLTPAFISLSSAPLLLTGLQTNLDGTRTTFPQAATEPLMQQRSPSPRGANEYLRHEDSGVRIPPAVDELPPFYTPE